jgi:adenylate cyclase
VNGPCPAPSPEDKEELSDFLLSLGATRDEIRRAEEEGRRGQLAGDLALTSGTHLSARDLARKASLDLDEVVGLWRAVGVEVEDPDEAMFSDEDLAHVTTLCGIDLFEHDKGDEVLRVVGSSLARSAEAAIAFYIQNVEGGLSDSGASETEMAKKSVKAVDLALTLGESLPSLFAHHLRSAIRRQRLSMSQVTDRAMSRLAVGFVDLVGFTPLSHRMGAGELSDFVSQFESRAFQVAADGQGRIVKHIGDEIMFVALGPEDGCHLALALMEEFTEEGIQPRAGISFGDVVTRQGDYYGLVVNLASRLTDLAIPGEVLCDSTVPEAVEDRTLVFASAGRRQLKGFDDPVSVFSVEHAPVRGTVTSGSPAKERHSA